MVARPCGRPRGARARQAPSGRYRCPILLVFCLILLVFIVVFVVLQLLVTTAPSARGPAGPRSRDHACCRHGAPLVTRGRCVPLAWCRRGFQFLAWCGRGFQFLAWCRRGF